ncbi:MAG: hypothetical protein CL908_08320 [Deltaproteobacteria bacterium]|nr:hypothetical protein [Deltaproteobacteria bacterium]
MPEELRPASEESVGDPGNRLRPDSPCADTGPFELRSAIVGEIRGAKRCMPVADHSRTRPWRT